MVEASLIILHRNPFYLLWGFFLYSFANSGQNSDCDKTNSSFRLQCTHYMYTRVAISATSLSSRFIEWKNCKAFSDPSENRSACSLYSWHYMYLKIPLFICIRKFSILAVISEFQSSPVIMGHRYCYYSKNIFIHSEWSRPLFRLYWSPIEEFPALYKKYRKILKFKR